MAVTTKRVDERNLKRFVQNTSLILAGFIVTILILEVIVRLVGLHPLQPDASYWELVSLVGDLPKPYEQFAYDSAVEGEFSSWVRFNAYSLPDIDHSFDKGEQQRVLFLGDSFTAAWEVGFEDSFTTHIRNWLAESDTPLDIINAGFHGWGTDRQFLWYEAVGQNFDADLVVLQVYAGNDITDNGVCALADLDQFDGINVYERQPRRLNRPCFRINEGELQFCANGS